MCLGNMTHAQLTLHTVEDLAASLVRRHGASMPTTTHFDSSAAADRTAMRKIDGSHLHVTRSG